MAAVVRGLTEQMQRHLADRPPLPLGLPGCGRLRDQVVEALHLRDHTVIVRGGPVVLVQPIRECLALIEGVRVHSRVHVELGVLVALADGRGMFAFATCEVLDQAADGESTDR